MNIFEVLVVQPLFNLLMLLYVIVPGGDFGVSIILFTILLRIVLHPLVKRQLHQTKLMRKLQPELEQIKKRNKGNRQMQGLQMMELYKKHGVSPFRSIGILLIQLPIFIALFLVIKVFTEHRERLEVFTYDILENISQIKHIVDNPTDFNVSFLGVIDLTQHAISAQGINLLLVGLAVAAAVGQYYQSKQIMPKDENKRRLRDIMADAANGKEADQAEINAAVMNKMVVILPFLMLFIMLSLPGAIALYYATSTLVTLLQQSIILKQDEEELEELASHPAPKKAGKKATAKARAKAANEATVTRIVAKDTKAKKSQKGR